MGLSALSSEVQILCSRIPDAPVSLLNNAAVTTHLVIGFTWSSGASNGGSPVIDYRISYDQATSTWIPLATGITTLSFTTTNPLVEGTTYKFKVEARNVVGYSATSTEIAILAAKLPDAPTNLLNLPLITDQTKIGLSW